MRNEVTSAATGAACVCFKHPGQAARALETIQHQAAGVPGALKVRAKVPHACPCQEHQHLGGLGELPTTCCCLVARPCTGQLLAQQQNLRWRPRRRASRQALTCATRRRGAPSASCSAPAKAHQELSAAGAACCPLPGGRCRPAAPTCGRARARRRPGPGTGSTRRPACWWATCRATWARPRCWAPATRAARAGAWTRASRRRRPPPSRTALSGLRARPARRVERALPGARAPLLRTSTVACTPPECKQGLGGQRRRQSRRTLHA